VPENWVSDYMQDDNREREIELRKAKFVDTGAEGLFRQLWNQVETDIARFHDAGGDSGLTSQFMPSCTFVVRRIEGYPTIDLEVTVQNGYIAYSRQVKSDRVSSEETKEGQLRIVSDLQGRLQVKHNGEPFKDHAALSKFLLLPVFEYLRKNQ